MFGGRDWIAMAGSRQQSKWTIESDLGGNSENVCSETEKRFRQRARNSTTSHDKLWRFGDAVSVLPYLREASFRFER